MKKIHNRSARQGHSGFLATIIIGTLLVACAEPEVIVASDWSDGRMSEVSHDEPVRDPSKDDSDGAYPGAWDWYNAPERIEEGLERNYARLPRHGQANKTPWTDTYWPKKDGGIRVRWVGEFTEASPTAARLASMTLEERAGLSPTEKYDALVGNYKYSLTHRAESESPSTEPAWAGYCHGWASAAIHFEEPAPVTLVNPDGIEIPFGSADIKALLTYFQGEVVRSRYTKAQIPFMTTTKMLGTVCGSGWATSADCYDTNPGAFHIVMANYLARGEAFGIDADRGREKWNQPVHAFYTEELGRMAPSAGASPEAVTQVVVQSAVTYTQEIHAQWEPALGTEMHSDTTKYYIYSLELDGAGDIVGGQWMVGAEGGGFLTLHEVVQFFVNEGKSMTDASQAASRYFDYPDYVWVQERGEFPSEFRMAASEYEIMANTKTNRELLYAYLGQLGAIYEASIRN